MKNMILMSAVLMVVRFFGAPLAHAETPVEFYHSHTFVGRDDVRLIVDKQIMRLSKDERACVDQFNLQLAEILRQDASAKKVFKQLKIYKTTIHVIPEVKNAFYLINSFAFSSFSDARNVELSLAIGIGSNGKCVLPKADWILEEFKRYNDEELQAFYRFQDAAKDFRTILSTVRHGDTTVTEARGAPDKTPPSAQLAAQPKAVESTDAGIISR